MTTESAPPAGASPETLRQRRQAAGAADADGVPALSASVAHVLVSKSGLHAWTAHPRLNPDYQQTESGEFDYGRASHAVLLEGSEASLYVIEADDWRTKAAKEARDNARKQGRTPLLVKQVYRVRAMVAAAKAYISASEIPDVFANGEPEHSIKWQEGDTLCRSRLDWISGDRKLILDYKTTVNANPASFVGMAVSYGYTMQEAFYRRGVESVYGTRPKFVFLLQEKELPYACSLVAFDPAMQAIGDQQAQYALALWQNCMATGEWRGYPSRIAYIDPPAWYLARAEGWLDETLEQGEQA